jgi:hypothetical protein
MSTRSFTLLVGFLYLAGGLLGFLPGLIQPPPTDAPRLAVEGGYGYLLGLFPINTLHNLVHLVIGAWGLVASRSFAAARLFARGLAVIYGVLTIMGLFPGVDTAFGFIPLFGHDVWLHGITTLVAVYFGFLAPAEVTRVRRTDIKSDRVKVYEERPPI